MTIGVSLNDKQLRRLGAWEEEQDELWAKSQNQKEPNYGIMSGAITWMLTQTSLGMIVKVKHATGSELDLSDYENW